MTLGLQAHTDADRSADSELIYLDLRLRILHAQFLPDQLVELANVVSHFSTTRSAVERAIEMLSADGYVRPTMRGGYSVRRFSPEEVAATETLSRRLALVGLRSLIEQPSDSELAQLKSTADWKLLSPDDGPSYIENFTQRTRKIHQLLMRKPSVNGVLSPIRLLLSPALHRIIVHAMTHEDVRQLWQTTIALCEAALAKDFDKAAELALNVPDHQARAKALISRVNSLPAAPTASLFMALPEFHILIGDDPAYPYFGLGMKDS